MIVSPDIAPPEQPARIQGIGIIGRVLFALCCAVIVFMAVHGDEHGRRPRFVWRSAEDTIKVAQLQTTDHNRTGVPLGATPPAIAAETDVGSLPLPSGLARASNFAISRLPDASRYLLPFSIGPPQTA